MQVVQVQVVQVRCVMDHVNMQKRPPAFKARMAVVDIVQKKRIAYVVGYGQTLEIINSLESLCKSSISGGRYACEDATLYFLRRGHRECDTGTCQWTFLEEPEDI